MIDHLLSLNMIKELVNVLIVLILIYIIWNWFNPLIFNQVLFPVMDKAILAAHPTQDQLDLWNKVKTLVKWMIDIGLFIVIYAGIVWVYRRATRKEPNEQPVYGQP